MRVVVWWCIPCKGILPIFESFSKNFGEVRFIVEKLNSESRELLGWKIKKANSFVLESLDRQDWKAYVDIVIQEELESIHIMNGIGVFPKLHYVLDALVNKNISYGILAEAPHNPYQGILRVLKQFHTNYIKKYTHLKYKKTADFYFSASGDTKQILLDIGWSSDKIFPFGYFTEFVEYSKSDRNNQKKIRLLCTGYITKNKSHILLLKALNELGEEAMYFETNITGYGPEKENLNKYIIKNNLKNVNLLGVIETEELNDLMNNSDVLVATGYEEPWGIRINEAIMHELFLISSSGIGASEVVKDLNAGYVFKKGNHLDLANCLRKLIQEKEVINTRKRENLKNKIAPELAAKYLKQSLKLIYKKKEIQKIKPWEFN